MNYPKAKGVAAFAQPERKSSVRQAAEWRFPVENSFVRDTAISVEARLLYIIIKGYVGPNCANPFPSLATLSRHMDRHRESVQKYLSELEEEGYLRREHAKVDGKFVSTRYTLFDHSGKKPLRKIPTTEKPATKKYQFKEVPVSKDSPSSKESKETANEFAAGSLEEIPSTWKPDSRTKKQKLAALKMPKDYPSEREFDRFVESNELDGIAAYRPDLYDQTCRNKWHTWRADIEKWAKIIDWKKYVAGLNSTIDYAHGGGF